MPNGNAIGSRCKRRRGRAAFLTLTALLLCGLLATAYVPAVESARPRRDRAATSDSGGAGYEPVAMRDALASVPQGGVTTRVKGGSSVPQGAYSFTTFVEVDIGGGFAIHCGGTLIDPLFVLTAAHCVEDENGAVFNANRFTLAIGNVNLNQLEDENIFDVVDVSQHPNWNPGTFSNDVAVLELADAVPADIAQPLSIVASGDTQYDAAGETAVVAGWGVTSNKGRASDTLLAANLDVVSDANCEDFFGPINTAAILCAGRVDRTSCSGDSGGPLFAAEPASSSSRATSGGRVSAEGDHGPKAEGKKHKKHRKHKRHNKKRHGNNPPAVSNPILEPVVQIGVVSFGAIGCPRGVPSGYAQLSAPAINDFITDEVGP